MWTTDQRRIINWWRNGTELVCAAEGTVRSGKTVAMVYGLLDHTVNRPGYTGVLAGRTAGAVRRTLIPLIDSWCATLGYQATERRDPPRVLITGPGVNATLHVFGAPTRQSEAALRGITLDGALLDEAADMERGFVEEILARASQPHSKVGWTLNPSAPEHWIKRHYLDRHTETATLCVRCDLRDNPGLDPGYLDRLMALYGPGTLAARRRLGGEWVAASGLVWPQVGAALIAPPPTADAVRWLVGIDVAYSSVTHAVLVGQWRLEGRDVWWVTDEWRWDHATAGRMDDGAQTARIVERWAKYRPESWTVDPAAAAFLAVLRSRVGSRRARPAVTDVLDGVHLVGWWLGDRLFVSPRCVGLVGEMRSYRWDERAAERGEDRPEKVNDHGCDALRYAVYTSAVKDGGGAGSARLAAEGGRGVAHPQVAPTFN